MRTLMAFSAVLVLHSQVAIATSSCPSDFYSYDDCVPLPVIEKALKSAAGKPFIEWVRDLYSAASEATGKKNQLIENRATERVALTEMFPDGLAFFGKQDWQPARAKQLELLQAYCVANEGKVKQFKTPANEGHVRIDAICVGRDNNGIGGVSVLPPYRHYDISSRYLLMVIYMPLEVAKEITDFWKNIKVGDKASAGMVIEVKPPIAKIQTTYMKKEEWVEIETLIPKDVMKK